MIKLVANATLIPNQPLPWVPCVLTAVGFFLFWQASPAHSANSGLIEYTQQNYSTSVTRPVKYPTTWKFTPFPAAPLFTAPIADAREPRFSAGMAQVYFFAENGPSERTNAILVARAVAGTTHEFLRASRGDQAFGIALTAGVFSEFDLDTRSDELLHADYLLGMPVTYRLGNWSSRIRIMHLSSHLGDEFLERRVQAEPLDLAYEAIDTLVARSGERWRLYVGGGYILRSQPRLHRGMLQSGVELLPHGVRTFSPVAAIDVRMMGSQSWRPHWDLLMGLQWTSLTTRRGIRLIANFTDGYNPIGQEFRTQRIRGVGMAMQLISIDSGASSLERHPREEPGFDSIHAD
jgi:hypothetical protein